MPKRRECWSYWIQASSARISKTCSLVLINLTSVRVGQITEGVVSRGKFRHGLSLFCGEKLPFQFYSETCENKGKTCAWPNAVCVRQLSTMSR